MKKKVTEFVNSCHICQTQKASSLVPAGLLQPLPIPNQVWEEISLDSVEGLPLSQSFNYIMVVVDRLSKYSHFLPLKCPFTIATVVEKFICKIVWLHRVPLAITFDRNKVFTSHFWKELHLSYELLLSPPNTQSNRRG